MLDNFKLYHTWHARLVQLMPDDCETRLTNMTLLVVGLYHAGHVHLSAIARKWQLRAKTVSLTRRLTRFLANPAVRVRDWYAPVAQQLLAPFVGREVRLIIDGSKVGFGHQLLLVAVAYRRRSLPLAWCWVNVTQGHSSYQKQLALLAYVRSLLPPDTGVLLVGDGEFGSIPVLRQLDAWRWHFVLRQKANNLVQIAHGQTWCWFKHLVIEREQLYWWPQSHLTKRHGYHTNLLAYWAPGEDDPWLLATNLPSARTALQAYRRRMWIEEMLGDMKGHGFDLEATHLRHFLRLSRLTLAVCLLYVWLVATGARTIKSGQRHLVDRNERRDLSIFRIGWNMIERRLALGNPVHVSFHLYL